MDLLTVHRCPHSLGKAVDNLNGLHCSYPSLILGESIQPLECRVDVLPSGKLSYRFLRVTSNHINVSEEGLTWLSLLDEFGRQREDEEQLPERLHNNLCHSGCRTDFGIDGEVFQKGLDRFE